MSHAMKARGLGIAGIGIGISELVMPRQIERLLGVEPGRYCGMLRVLGIREILHGVDILAHEDPTPGVRARVVGDGLDLALLGAAVRESRSPGGLALALTMVLGIGALDALLSRRPDRPHHGRPSPARREAVRRPAPASPPEFALR
jgi:hypothetical protein